MNIYCQLVWKELARNEIIVRCYSLKHNSVSHTLVWPMTYDLCDKVSNKNVDITFSAHGAFTEWPSSGTLKIKWLQANWIYSQSQNTWKTNHLKVLGAIKPNGLKKIAKMG